MYTVHSHTSSQIMWEWQLLASHRDWVGKWRWYGVNFYAAWLAGGLKRRGFGLLWRDICKSHNVYWGLLLLGLGLLERWTPTTPSSPWQRVLVKPKSICLEARNSAMGTLTQIWLHFNSSPIPRLNSKAEVIPFFIQYASCQPFFISRSRCYPII